MKKGKCQQCVVVRVGGGYMILDGTELMDKERARRTRGKWRGKEGGREGGKEGEMEGEEREREKYIR